MPDSELLDQSLRPAGETREAPVEEVEPRSRRGAHRFGFTLAVFLALILLIVYVLEPQIADAWPQGTPHLERYVALVNQARHVTAGLFASLVEVVRNLLAEYI